MPETRQDKISSYVKPDPGLGAERIATSPSLNVHLHSFAGRTITSYHPKATKTKKKTLIQYVNRKKKQNTLGGIFQQKFNTKRFQ